MTKKKKSYLLTINIEINLELIFFKKGDFTFFFLFNSLIITYNEINHLGYVSNSDNSFRTKTEPKIVFETQKNPPNFNGGLGLIPNLFQQFNSSTQFPVARRNFGHKT